jgi:hypothetical protein
LPPLRDATGPKDAAFPGPPPTCRGRAVPLERFRAAATAYLFQLTPFVDAGVRHYRSAALF